jgi:hypothetical protein
MAKRRRRSGSPESPSPGDRLPRRLLALAIFAAALISRVFFWRATPDAAGGWTAYFQGDAPLWLDYARAIELGRPFELGLPIHPPGAAWLVALLWNGVPSGIPFLRFAWVALGALVPLLVFLAAARSFPLRVAAVAGVWCAASTGFLVLSTSTNNETPYLVLLAGSLWFFEDLRERPRIGRLALWSIVNAVACLFRVEHLLFYLFALVFLAARWARAVDWRALRLAAASVFFFALPLVPWHATAWSAVARFNEEPRTLTPVEERAVTGVEEATRGIAWTPEAARMRDEMPGFARRTAAAFVLATAAHRGSRVIGAPEFRVLEQAFGYVPKRLSPYPFVSSYGPLNFALANHAGATGGFDRSPLGEPPALAGGRASYPAFLVRGLPPADLTFVYPPHLRLFNEGYAIGWRWIAGHPADFVRLALRKLAIFWEGAASGFTGYNFPMGLSGSRRAVDLVTAEGGVATAWRVVVLAVAVVGLLTGRGGAAVLPWLLFLASKVVVTVLFFGYARHGATVVPVLALLAGLAAERWMFSRSRPVSPGATARAVAAVVAICVAVEGARFLAKPQIRVDGVAIRAAAPSSADDHRSRRIEVGSGR